jgi:aspartate aminotransferase-like enzyme
MRERHGMVIANGQDQLKDVSFRIGHMGAYDQADILAVVGALEDALGAAGVTVEPGTGLVAARRVFAGEAAGAGVGARGAA